MSAPVPSVSLLRGARVPGRGRVDIDVVDGVVASIRTHGERAVPVGAFETVDLEGYLLLPGLVEPHAHLDKALTAGLVPNPTGDLAGAITAWLGARRRFSTEEVAERAEQAARRLIARGASVIRTHADTGEDIGTSGIEAVLEVRDRLAPLAEIQVVACGGLPLTGAAGAAHRDLLEQGLAAGADAVGGAPWLDADPVEALHILADAAVRHGVPLDVHIDETCDPGTLTLGDLIDLADEGFPHAITASHAVSLGVQPQDVQRDYADRLAQAGIGVVVLPVTNLFLQGRAVPVAPPRGLAPVRALLAAGVAVGAGGDNVQDPFNLLGRSDPLDVAGLLVAAAHVTFDEALHAVTAGARASIDAPAHGVEVGARADFVAVRAAGVAEAIADAWVDRIVLRAGAPVVSTTHAVEWSAPSASPRLQAVFA